MSFNAGLLAAGSILYATMVIMPTGPLLMEHYEVNNTFIERVGVGFLGYLAGHWIVRGLYGEDANRVVQQRFFGIRWGWLLAGLAAVYLAWFTNTPQAIAGTLDSKLVITNGDQALSLATVAERVITSLITFGAAFLVKLGVTTDRSPQQRRQDRIENRVRVRQERHRYVGSDYDEA